MTTQNICHESFHAAMSVCQHCNMSLGFKVGEDEHAAYIAGFVGNCADEMFGFLEEEKMAKKNKSDWKPSENILKYLKSWEKFEPELYDDKKGNITIGYGFHLPHLLKNTRMV